MEFWVHSESTFFGRWRQSSSLCERQSAEGCVEQRGGREYREPAESGELDQLFKDPDALITDAGKERTRWRRGGGAWKVAYADFVTAMMACFLVMWIRDRASRQAGHRAVFRRPSGDESRLASTSLKGLRIRPR